jgi:hypothetical protein
MIPLSAKEISLDSPFKLIYVHKEIKKHEDRSKIFCYTGILACLFGGADNCRYLTKSAKYISHEEFNYITRAQDNKLPVTKKCIYIYINPKCKEA